MSGDVRSLRQLFSDVSRPKPSGLAPVCVPIRPVRAAGAAVLSTADGLEPVCDFGVLRWAVQLEAGPVAVEQQPAHEDHEAPEVIFIQASDRPDQLSIDRHEQPFLGSRLPKRPKQG